MITAGTSRVRRKRCRVAIVAALLLLPASTLAQRDEGPPPTTQEDDHGGRWRRGQMRGPRRGPGDEPGRGPGWLGGMGLGMPYLKLGPEDRQPLAEGEEEELTEFAQQNVPRLYEALKTLRQQDPQRFEEKLIEIVPRLRQFKRMYEHNPRIAKIIKAHIENRFDIRRTARTLAHAPGDSALHARALHEIRFLVAANLHLETQALRLLEDEQRASRETRAAQRLNYLLSNEADLAPETARLRELIADYHAATDELQRAALKEKAAAYVLRQIDNDIDALKERIARMEESAAEEVDGRVEQLLESTKHRGREHRGRGRRAPDGHPLPDRPPPRR